MNRFFSKLSNQDLLELAKRDKMPLDFYVDLTARINLSYFLGIARHLLKTRVEHGIRYRHDRIALNYLEIGMPKDLNHYTLMSIVNVQLNYLRMSITVAGEIANYGYIVTVNNERVERARQKANFLEIRINELNDIL